MCQAFRSTARFTNLLILKLLYCRITLNIFYLFLLSLLFLPLCLPHSALFTTVEASVNLPYILLRTRLFHWAVFSAFVLTVQIVIICAPAKGHLSMGLSSCPPTYLDEITFQSVTASFSTGFILYLHSIFNFSLEPNCEPCQVRDLLHPSCLHPLVLLGIQHELHKYWILNRAILCKSAKSATLHECM